MYDKKNFLPPTTQKIPQKNKIAPNNKVKNEKE